MVGVDLALLQLPRGLGDNWGASPAFQAEAEAHSIMEAVDCAKINGQLPTLSPEMI